MPPEDKKSGSETLDPTKLGEKLAQKEIDALQNAGKTTPEASPDAARLAEYAQKKAAIEAEVEKKKAEFMTTAPEKKAEQPAGKAPETASAQPAAQPTTAPTSTPTPVKTPEATPPAPTTTPEPPKAGGTMDKFKDFFAKISAGFTAFFKQFTDKISEMTGKLFGKKPSSQPAAVASTPDSTIDKPIGADDTWGLKGDALIKNPNFHNRAEQIAAKIGVSLADLLEIFKIESGVDPQIVNKVSGATGLIQWMPSTAPHYGTSVQELRKMSGLQQLDYVEKFYKPYFGKMKSFSNLYRAVFFPAAIGKGPDYVFGAPNMDFARKVAQQNPVFAKYSNRPDGLIDNAGFEKYCATRSRSSSLLVS